MAHEKVYAICENYCREETMTKEQIEEMAKISLVPIEGSSIPLENNCVYRAAGAVSDLTISLPGAENIFSAELQFKAGSNARLGIYHPFNDINVNGMTFSETTLTGDYYTLEADKIYDILIWYDGFRVNVVVI